MKKQVPVDDVEVEVAALEQTHRIVGVTVDPSDENATIEFEPRVERTAPGDVETRS